MEIKLDADTPRTAKEGETELTVVNPRVRLHHLLQRPFDTRSVATTGLFLLAIFYTMYFVRSLLLPFVLALLLSYLFRPIIRAMAKVRIPPAIASAVLLLAVVGGLAYTTSLLIEPVTKWLERAPSSMRELERHLQTLKRPMEKVAQASGTIEDLTKSGSQGSATPEVEVKQHPLARSLREQAPEVVLGGITMLILLYFLLAYDGVFLGKLIRLMPTFSDKKRAVLIATEIQTQISRYLFTVTLINCCLGTAVGTTVGLLGLPNPLMWGVLVAVLNFVPYLGALTGIVCMTVGAILSFDSVGYALLSPACYLGLAVLEGNFITPMVMGRTLTLNPVLVLLSLTFWGWMWGIIGVILAVPILATFKIFCSHIKSMEPLAEFIS